MAATVAMHVSPEPYRMSRYQFHRLYSSVDLPRLTVPIPLVATVLPDKVYGHIVLVSYYKEFNSYVKRVMPSLWGDDERSVSVEMSRFFLEASEHIHINPRHWKRWSRKKRRLIRTLFSGTHPLPGLFDPNDLHNLTDHERNAKYNAQFADVDEIDSVKVNLFI